jgi:FdrA protein
MIFQQAIVRKNQYQDSVRLMSVSRKAGGLPGVLKVMAILGTDSNKKVLADLGLMSATVSAATPNDLVICVEAETSGAVDAAVAEVDALLKTVATGQAQAEKPKSIDDAMDKLPGANFALISLPGRLAKLDVTTALARGLNVMLFSDNISIADEIEFKRLAVANGVLCMGPDCGTAIVNGVPLAFANVVRRGSIGLAAASGTGIQEVTCLIDRFGGGVSHAIGVGGRDLKKEVGGLMMCQAIRSLAQDPNTRSLIILSKPGDPAVLRKVLDEAKATGLKVVACLLGADQDTASSYPDVTLVSTLEAAAFEALGQPIPEMVFPEALKKRINGLDPRRRYLRGLYSGGTLCYETLFILKDHLDVQSNVPIRPDLNLHYPAKGTAHCCVDLGEDDFTQGVPHPMIDLGTRIERLNEDIRDPSVKVVLLDIMLGYGSNRHSAALLAPVLVSARAGLADGGPVILVHICGTDTDPQPMDEQVRVLEEAGAFLFPTNAQAARAALAIIQ